MSIANRSAHSASCGGWDNHWTYSGRTEGPRDRFWMVQEIIITRDGTLCTDRNRHNDQSDHWLEAIEVHGAFLLDDHDQIPSMPSYYGPGPSVVAQATMIRYSTRRGREIGGWGSQVREAGSMNSTRSIPSWWSTVGFMGFRRSWKDHWICCCRVYHGQLHHSP